MSTINISTEHGFNAVKEFIGSEDFFLEAYCNAIKELKIIIDSFNDDNPKTLCIETPNNIIAFTGDRGQGKTSAMYAFVNILENIDTSKKNNNNELLKLESIEKIKFHKLDPIDPSSFEKHHNIIHTIIALMFKTFDTKFKNDNKQRCDSTNKLLQEFNAAFEALSVKHYDMNDFSLNYENNIYKLSQLGDSTHLKMRLQSLVQLYLEYMGYSEKSALLIPIDDLDLSLNNAHEIAEDIRKYLLIPRVVIIMAVKFDQLQQCIENAQKGSTKMNTQDMAVKYLNKLIPIKHRIALPSPRSEDAHVVIQDQKYSSIVDIIFDILYEKTGIVLNSAKKQNHPFVPATLRELVSLVLFLHNLPDGDLKGALSQFQKFLVDSWVLDKITEEHITIIKSLFSINDSDKNNYICGKLLKIISSNLININHNYDIKNSYIKTINDEYLYKVYSKKCSYGDVLSLTTILEEISEENTIQNFVFTIRTLYTARLHELCEHEKKSDILNIFGENLFGHRFDYKRHALAATPSMIIRNSWGYFDYKLEGQDEDYLFSAALVSDKVIAGNNQIYNKATFDISIFFLSLMNRILVHNKLNIQTKYDQKLDAFYKDNIEDSTMKVFINMENVSNIINHLILEAPNMRSDSSKNETIFDAFFTKYSLQLASIKGLKSFDFKNKETIISNWVKLHDATVPEAKEQPRVQIKQMPRLPNNITPEALTSFILLGQVLINSTKDKDIITEETAMQLFISLTELQNNISTYFDAGKLTKEGRKKYNEIKDEFNKAITQ